tara:strand:+ start:4091 stop:4384 length:294 start_codon:yes stop_codon:yes gene_type:complete
MEATLRDRVAEFMHQEYCSWVAQALAKGRDQADEGDAGVLCEWLNPFYRVAEDIREYWRVAADEILEIVNESKEIQELRARSWAKEDLGEASGETDE